MRLHHVFSNPRVLTDVFLAGLCEEVLCLEHPKDFAGKNWTARGQSKSEEGFTCTVLDIRKTQTESAAILQKIWRAFHDIRTMVSNIKLCLRSASVPSYPNPGSTMVGDDPATCRRVPRQKSRCDRVYEPLTSQAPALVVSPCGRQFVEPRGIGDGHSAHARFACLFVRHRSCYISDEAAPYCDPHSSCRMVSLERHFVDTRLPWKIVRNMLAQSPSMEQPISYNISRSRAVFRWLICGNSTLFVLVGLHCGVLGHVSL
jgi:hypothetical protein